MCHFEGRSGLRWSEASQHTKLRVHSEDLHPLWRRLKSPEGPCCQVERLPVVSGAPHLDGAQALISSIVSEAACCRAACCHGASSQAGCFERGAALSCACGPLRTVARRLQNHNHAPDRSGYLCTYFRRTTAFKLMGIAHAFPSLRHRSHHAEGRQNESISLSILGVGYLQDVGMASIFKSCMPVSLVMQHSPFLVVTERG